MYKVVEAYVGLDGRVYIRVRPFDWRLDEQLPRPSHPREAEKPEDKP